MKKIFVLILSLGLLLLTASPALATECQQVKIERYHRVFVRVVCDNPTQPVNLNITAQSGDGRITSKITIQTSGNTTSSYVNVVAISGSH